MGAHRGELLSSDSADELPNAKDPFGAGYAEPENRETFSGETLRNGGVREFF